MPIHAKYILIPNYMYIDRTLIVQLMVAQIIEEFLAHSGIITFIIMQDIRLSLWF